MISFRRLLLGVTAAALLVGQVFAAPYATTGVGTSTIGGTTPDYATLSTACAAITTAGSRDATEWVFLIQGNIAETANSCIMCTVATGGSIVFRPAPGVQATISWPVIADNAGTSGRIVIGANTAAAGLKKTDNIIFDGCNTPGGKTRDLFLLGISGETTSGYFIAIRGNSDGCQFKNLMIRGMSSTGNASCIAFRADQSTAGATANYVPDNWVVDNCWLQQSGSQSGNSIYGASVTGTLPAGTQMSGWSITNNLLVTGTRSIFTYGGSGTISGNTFRCVAAGGFQQTSIWHYGANGITGFTWTIDKNIFDNMQQQNASAGDYGPATIIVGPAAPSSGTYNITNNMIGGYYFTGAAANGNYQAIRVTGDSPDTVVNIEHNSINMPHTASVTATGPGRAYAIGRTKPTNPQQVNIKNNIIRFLHTGAQAYAIWAEVGTKLVSDGNDIWASGSKVGVLGAPNVTPTYKALFNNVAYVGVDTTHFWTNQCVNVALDPADAAFDSVTSRVLTAAGSYYVTFASVGTDVSGAALTVTNKAWAANVATLTTSAPHGLAIGNPVKVALSPADTYYDGVFAVAAVPSTTTFTYTKTQTAGATSGVATGSVYPPTTTAGTVGGAEAGNGLYTTFADWQTGGFDANGQNVDPGSTTGGIWASGPLPKQNGDLHFTGIPTTLANTTVLATLAACNTDMDGDTRTAGACKPGADEPTAGSSSYTWTGATNSDMNVATNWNPNRTSPRWNDTLVLDGASVASPAVMIRDSHIGGLKVINSATAVITTFGPYNRLQVYDGSNSTAADFAIEAGSSLRLTGAYSTYLEVVGAATASISGDMIFNASTASVPQFLLGKTAGSVAFENGSACLMVPATSGGGNCFGSSATLDGAGGSAVDSTGVVFKSGSAYYSGGYKDGTPSAAMPSNPFVLTAPQSMVEFKPGSDFISLGTGSPSVAGRTFGYGGNYIVRSSGTLSLSGGTNWTVGGDMIVRAGTLSFGMTAPLTTIGGNLVVESASTGFTDAAAPTAASVVDIKGNVDVQGASLFTPSTNAFRAFQLSGTAPQTANFQGKTLPNFTLLNLSGATLTTSATVSGVLALTSGVLTTTVPNVIVAADGASAITRGATGWVNGPLVRIVGATTGARAFPIGTATDYLPLTVTFNAAPAIGYLGVGTLSAAHPAVPSYAAAINRCWSFQTGAPAAVDCSINFSYLAGEVGSAQEDKLAAQRYTGSGTTWTPFATTVDTGAHTALASSVTGFSDWTLFAVPTIQLPVASNDFGLQNTLDYGGTTHDQSFTVNNTGGATLSISAINHSGSADFAVQSPSSFPVTVPAGGNTSITIRYSPNLITAQNASFAVLSNDPATPSTNITVQGQGAKPDINVVTPDGLDFGYVLVSSPATPLTLRIENLGSAALNISGISPAGSAEITWTAPTFPVVIPASSFQEFEINFTPLATSSYSKTFTIASDSPGELSIGRTFTGQGSNVTVSSPVDFGFVKTTQTGSANIAINNTNGAVATTYTLSVGNPAKFSAVADDFVYVAAGATANLPVQYAPTAVATDTSTFTLTSSDMGAPDLSGELTGRGWATIHGKKAAINGTAGGTVQVESDGTYNYSKIVVAPGAFTGTKTFTIQEPSDNHGKPMAVECLPAGPIGGTVKLYVEFKTADIGGPNAGWWVNQAVMVWNGAEFAVVSGTMTNADAGGGAFTCSVDVTTFSTYATAMDPAKASVTDWRIFE